MSTPNPIPRGAFRPRIVRLGWIAAIVAAISGSATGQEAVTVYRDAIGLAHVYADTDQALVYGLGRMHVRERPLRTLYNLTRAAGALTRTLGQADPKAPQASDPHIRHDRRALRYHRESRARWLLAHYQRTGAPAEDRTLSDLLTAYVRGINDERAALRPILTGYFLRYLGDLPPEFRLTRDQYDALCARPVETWEPLALYHLVMRSLWEDQIDNHGAAAPSRLGRVLPTGSNSFCVPPGGSASGHTFLFADPHQESSWYVATRFRARRGLLDGGGFTVSGLPFLLVGFGANVSWTLTLSAAVPVDFYTYDGDVRNSPGSYVDDTGQTVALRVRTHALPVRLTPGGALSTIHVTDRYLDVSEDMPVTGTAPGRDGHAHLLCTSRFSYGGPEPPTASDPGCDPCRMYYRLLTARDADDALQRAIGETLSITGLNVTICDNRRGITFLGSRMPHRRHERPFYAGWRSDNQTEHMSGRDHGWQPVNGRLLHPVGDLPTVRSDGATPVRAGRPVRFWANCNTTPIWLLGLAHTFGLPDSMRPYDGEHPDYVNPFDPDDYVRRPTSLTGMRHFGPPFGSHTLRQEWMTLGLKAAWDAGRTAQPPGITEPVLTAMITDTHSPLPYFLALCGFFDELTAALPAGAARDLSKRLHTWAYHRKGPHALAPPADAADAARFRVFWAFFRREMPGPWERAWRRPFAWDFYTPSRHADVRTGGLKALALTVDVFRRYPNLDLAALKRYAIPFGGPDVPVPGCATAGFMSQDVWARPPWASGPPRIDGSSGGRMPMLVRMRKAGEAHHRVRVMMPAAAGRVNTLPEWTAVNGPGFHAAPVRWARVEPYELPMSEAALKALGYEPKVTLGFTYKPGKGGQDR